MSAWIGWRVASPPAWETKPEPAIFWPRSARSSSTTATRSNAALAGLDLAISYMGKGSAAEVRHLADEMVTVFRDLDLPREALAALLVFQETARRETATADLAREVAATLARARA